ncbi:ferredoxin-type protein NapF [Aggregatibacter actinomycetemcomitans]|uniref:ferredoxin-type protein NapF n=1 Tax=Aggregatibacter actinomycetemcomitans TaxID=714 RepID=UPI00197B3318|nr:ferredoxin-type protein NapF [Aggregatibacter actinomycetemcomitans]MBN6077917.1 ferredoxin-type protein NapF [Aggregatibacter actinomycetemcomitans]
MQKNETYYQAYLNHNAISRRGLFRGIFGAAESPSMENQRTANRPPFAAREDLFLTVCNGCGACVSACPNGLLRVQQHKAVLEMDYITCDLCGKCAEACPTHALHPCFPADTELRPYFSAECLQKQGQRCDVCVESCPQQAIHADLTVNHELCNGCGECQIACFISAIRLVRT